MADVIDDIINRTYQSTILNQDVVNDTEEAPAPTGLGAPMSGREGITSQQDVEQEQEQPRPTGAVMSYLKRLAQEYGYNAKAPQTGVRVPATTPTLDTTKMYDTYNTPLYDFMRNNEGGMDEDVSVWVRENRDLPSEVLDEYLRSIQDVYDTYGDRKQPRMIDAPEGQGELSNPEPLYRLSEEIDPGTIDTTDIPSGTGLMSPPETSFTVPEYKVFDSPDEMSDLEILARTIEAEARGEPFEGKIAVGATIANRAASGKYGKGIKGVILRRGQFSPWNSWTGYAKGEQGKDMMKLKASEESYKAANAILSGQYEDPTDGATHYVNERVSQPAWLDEMKGRKRGTLNIGNHLFGNADSNKKYDGKTWIENLEKRMSSPRPRLRDDE